MTKTLNRPALLFAGLASVLALGCTYQAHLLDQVAAASKMEVATAARADDLSAYAKCGAYDVTITAHDAASVSDATEAAFEYFDRPTCMDIGRGVAKAG